MKIEQSDKPDAVLSVSAFFYKIMEKIILCEINGKTAYKKGIDGYCYTFNKTEKSRRKAFLLALKSNNHGIRQE